MFSSKIWTYFVGNTNLKIYIFIFAYVYTNIWISTKFTANMIYMFSFSGLGDLY